MRVVWDIKKSVANVRSHGIESSHAATVLDDPLAITIEDTRHGEQRFVTVGSHGQNSRGFLCLLGRGGDQADISQESHP